MERPHGFLSGPRGAGKQIGVPTDEPCGDDTLSGWGGADGMLPEAGASKTTCMHNCGDSWDRALRLGRLFPGIPLAWPASGPARPGAAAACWATRRF